MSNSELIDKIFRELIRENKWLNVIKEKPIRTSSSRRELHTEILQRIARKGTFFEYLELKKEIHSIVEYMFDKYKPLPPLPPLLPLNLRPSTGTAFLNNKTNTFSFYNSSLFQTNSLSVSTPIVNTFSSSDISNPFDHCYSTENVTVNNELYTLNEGSEEGSPTFPNSYWYSSFNPSVSTFPKDPDEGAETEPDEAAETEPDEAVETEPDEAVETEPDEAVETEPDEAVETEPDEAVETEPDEAVETEPDEAVETEPDEGAETEPDSENESDYKVSPEPEQQSIIDQAINTALPEDDFEFFKNAVSVNLGDTWGMEVEGENSPREITDNDRIISLSFNDFSAAIGNTKEWVNANTFKELIEDPKFNKESIDTIYIHAETLSRINIFQLQKYIETGEIIIYNSVETRRLPTPPPPYPPPSLPLPPPPLSLPTPYDSPPPNSPTPISAGFETTEENHNSQGCYQQ